MPCINQAPRAPDVLICLILGGLRNILHAHDSMYVLNARYIRDAAFVRTRDSRRGIVVVTTCAVTGLRGGYKVARRMNNRRDIDIREERICTAGEEKQLFLGDSRRD